MNNERVYLRAFEMNDLAVLNKLRNDEELYKYTGGNRYFISSAYDQKWIEDKIFNNKTQLYLAVCLSADAQLIGYLSVNDIDLLNRKAQWGGIVIDKNEARKGYATEAALLMLKHVFEEMGLNMFWGYWLEEHKASLRMAEKLGFVKEGCLRDFVFKGNRFRSVYILSMLKDEYLKKYADAK